MTPYVSFDGGIGGPFAFIVAVIAALMLIAAWVILAGSRFVQGGVVERPERVPQLYGYTVCLIGLFMAVASVLSIADELLVLRSPEQGSDPNWGMMEPSVTSFEAFRSTYDATREMRRSTSDPPLATLSDDELRRRYEGLRADRIARNEAAARRSISTSLLSLIIGVGLFVFHWRWLQRRGAHVVGVERISTT